MDKIKLENVKIDNSVNYNYRDEDTLFFVNFKNLLLSAILSSSLCTIFFAIFESIQFDNPAICIIALNYLFYIGLMAFQIFVLLNYRFLIKKGLKKFSWVSYLGILTHFIFYIVILNIIFIGGPDLMHRVLN